MPPPDRVGVQASGVIMPVTVRSVLEAKAVETPVSSNALQRMLIDLFIISTCYFGERAHRSRLNLSGRDWGRNATNTKKNCPLYEKMFWAMAGVLTLVSPAM
jgi:hypothetical protein